MTTLPFLPRRWLRRTAWTVLGCWLASVSALAQPVVQLYAPGASGSITANDGTVTLRTGALASVAIQADGTFSGTLQVECTLNGTTYQALRIVPTNTTTAVTSFTTTGIWTASVVGCITTRVRATAWSSGTATVSLIGSSMTARAVGGQAIVDASQNGATAATFDVSRTSLELVTQTTAGTDETLSAAFTAFKFTATATEMGGFRVRLKRDSGLTAGTVNSYLYTDSAGSPGTNISDTTTGLPALLYAAGLTTSYAEYEFRLPQTGMTVGNPYWLVLNVASTAGGNVVLDRQTAGTNVFSTSANGSSWSTVSNKTAWVKVLGNAGRSYTGSTDTGATYYSTCSSGFCVRAINSGTGLAAKFDGTFQEGMGCTSLYGIGCRASSTFNHAFQAVAGPGGLAGAQIITQAAGQPGAQIVSTSGPALQLAPATGAFAQILPLDASAGGTISTWGWIAEEVTLGGGLTTDSTTNLLPANTVIDAICWRWTAGVTGLATAFQVGTSTDATAFQTTSASIALGNSGVGMNQWQSGGHVQSVTADSKVRITLNGTSSAGKLRLVVYYRAFAAPSS